MVKSQAMKMCSESFVLADKSKLEEVSFITFGEIADATLIIRKINGDTKIYDTNIIGVVEND